MYCPQKQSECVAPDCIGYHYQTYYTLNVIPESLIAYDLTAPVAFILDVGYCKVYSTPIDGGKLIKELEEYLKLI